MNESREDFADQLGRYVVRVGFTHINSGVYLTQK